MSDSVLAVAGLSKKYCTSLRRALGYGVRDIARDLIPRAGGPATLRRDEFWALEDVSFELHRGEALAVLGRNGAGKSTLLKLINGLLRPDAGEIRIRGRVGAIIELGAGFSPLLTGRENVAIGARLAGQAGASERRLLDAVIDFSGVGTFIDAPLQTYSSGMRARLAYALSAHLEPDLLLVDEALAVGDLDFQRKCVNHMRAYLAKGGALLFVSHNVLQVQAVCRRAILLERGRLAFEGDAAETVNRMIEASAPAQPEPAGEFDDDLPARILELRVEPVAAELRTGGAARVTLRYSAKEAVEAVWSFSVWTADLWVCVAGAAAAEPVRLEAGEGVLHCAIPRVPLIAGRYRLRAALIDPATHYPLARYGHLGDGPVLEVKSDAGAGDNLRVIAGQLTRLEVEWQ